MAAPTPTARSTPVGIKLDDGHSTKVTFATDPDISLWEKAVQPPGVDGGDEIQTTTMFNEVWRTTSPRQLKTLTPSTFKAAYDPAVYDQIVALVNVRTTITDTFPDGSTLASYGFLKARHAARSYRHGRANQLRPREQG
jgi:hypothetical protein